MNLRAVLLMCLLCAVLRGDEARLSPRYRTVYLMQMANELDQHLASRITNTRTLWVVLDPGSADAILTDSLDDAFWNWLARNYPTSATANGGGPGRERAARDSVQLASRHRGTVFLVDPRTRLVLWSTYELPKNSSPAELDRAATRVNNQLKAAFGKK
jgi:hypothetical protein